MGNIVAIVGRPNVGKSTLFNRLTEKREAIVDDISGVTRDRLYGHCEWNGKIFSVIDTGGYVYEPENVFEEEIAKQVKLAIEEADQIIFMTDVTTGITDLDKGVADLLRKSKKPVYIVTNKVDNNILLTETYQFYKLGFDEIFPISAINGSGTGELLDAICEKIVTTTEEECSEIPRITIVGRPNVGKSSLINSLLDAERNIVTNIAGTTRDAIKTRYNKFGFDFWLIDTAGLRRKSKVNEDLEFYSVMRAIRAIEHSDVCLLMINATIGFESQDQNILNIIRKNKKGVILIVNKWDLVEKNSKTANIYRQNLKQLLAPFNDIPILFVSAINKQRIFEVVETAMKVYNNLKQKIPTSQLNDYIHEIIDAYPPPSYKGKYIKIKYVTQLPTPSPTFAFFVNLPQYIKEPYKRYLENKLREKYDFSGVPVSLVFRPKSK